MPGTLKEVKMDLIKDLLVDSQEKIVMMIFDGLGGCVHPDYGQTELQAARIPVMDSLAKQGALALITMVAPGIAPGSGPGHLSLFGYDPVATDVGRGVLEALGLGFELGPNDLTARANFATTDDKGLIVDRRAGRPPQERTNELCKVLEENIRIPGYEVFVLPGRSHRFVPIIRGEGLSDKLSETDPQRTGVPVPDVQPLIQDAKHAADVVNEFVRQARKILKDYAPQNDLLLRGWGMLPDPPIEGFQERYHLKAAAIATYPMYKGVAKLVGMDVLETGKTFKEELDVLERVWNEYDFFYIHRKETDSAGHAGDFKAKVRELEDCDPQLERIVKLGPRVLFISGDHATPTAVKEHSFHEVPALFYGDLVIPDRCEGFDEVWAMQGGLGHIHGTDVMSLLLAYSQRLKKFKS